MKTLIIVMIVFMSGIVIIPSFAQLSSPSNNCPQGTKAEVQGVDIVCVPIGNIERTCPAETYHGVDNQGNPACRDIKTNQIVDPKTGTMYDSQTGDIILDDSQTTGIGIGVVFFIIVIIVIAVSTKKKSSTKESLPRRGWTDSEHKQILTRQNGRCAICGEVSGTFQFDHKDNNHYNNNLNNGQALCPNCHDRKSRGLN